MPTNKNIMYIISFQNLNITSRPLSAFTPFPAADPYSRSGLSKLFIAKLSKKRNKNMDFVHKTRNSVNSA